jgi:TATA-binding protein-associated factor
MQTDQILDLFNVSADSADPSALPPPPGAGGSGIHEDDAVDVTGEVREKGDKGGKGFLDEIGELWDEKQYDEELDLESFLAKMKG